MKSISLIAKVAVAAVMVVGLGACGKKSNKSSVAAVAAGYQTCPATGVIVNPTTGMQQQCVPGSSVYTGTSAGTYNNGLYNNANMYNQMYGNQYAGGTGCEQANAMYPGHYYQPVNGPYGPVCQLVY